MPRDGSGQYSQPFPNVVEGTEIESAVYNGYTADVTIDLNTPRPIVAGGTGANNAHDAMVALGGEIAGQVVTNYDSFPFVAGSFYSTAGATAAPNAHAFAGICYVTDANNMVLEARDQNDTIVPGRLYVREKKAGGWGAWKPDGRTIVGDAEGIGSDTADMFFGVKGTAPASQFIVNSESDAGGTNYLAIKRAGGTTIQGSGSFTPGSNVDAALTLTQAFGGGLLFKDSSYVAGIWTDGGGTALRFNVKGSLTTGFSTGPKFTITDNATTIDTASTTFGGTILATGNITTYGNFTTGGNSFAGRYYFGNGSGGGFKYLDWDGSVFTLAGGSLNVAGNIAALGSGELKSEGGIIRLGADGSKYLWYQGPNYIIAGGPTNRLVVGGPISVGYGGFVPVSANDSASIIASGSFGGGLTLQDGGNRATFYAASGNAIITTGANPPGSGTFKLNADGTAELTSGFMAAGVRCKPGYSAGMQANWHNVAWNGVPNLWIDNTNCGQFAFVSDYRIKKDVTDLPSMWDTVKALRPIKYTQAQFTLPSQVKAYLETKKRTEAIEKSLDPSVKQPEPKDAPPPIDYAQPMFPADDIERWGFIAHELQETMIESASSGVKDAVDTIQSPNPFTVIAALTKALQEAMARIEALEAR